ncbi:hypothetical protein GQ42DRAFT_117705 [Ramicandelaber brevisporus]|nr:hypothetical protein GQ42DRAFT_117705 [Ramicandelaber brevisporus]
MSAILERLRQLHEHRDRLETLATEHALQRHTTHSAKLSQQHDVSGILTQWCKATTDLAVLYDSISKQPGTAGAVSLLSQGHDQSHSIHKRKLNGNQHDGQPQKASIVMASNVWRRQVSTMFSPEETLGRYLDMQELHSMFINLNPGKLARAVTYVAYLRDLEHVAADNLTIEQRLKPGYARYLDELIKYLTGFIHRSRPLDNIVEYLRNADEQFAELWPQAQVPGWKQPAGQNDADQVNVFCPACQRGFNNTDVLAQHYASGKHKKRDDAVRPVALREYQSIRLISKLDKIRVDTLRNLQRRMAMLPDERAREAAEDEDTREAKLDALALLEAAAAATAASTDNNSRVRQFEKEAGDEEEEARQRMILGQDGKPIPSWLYKLRGMDQVYLCEICGGERYRGRKEYNDHFREQKHAQGLAMLGIPNSKQFDQIDKIDEAQTLWNQIKQSSSTQDVSRMVEEFEDAHGNIMNKKTYDDLKRQGLI